MKADNLPEFDKILYRFLTTCPVYEILEFDKVFPEIHRPKYKAQLISRVIVFQRTAILHPGRDISINSDCSKFQVLVHEKKVIDYKTYAR